MRLEDARVIVAGGRGLGGPEPFDDLRQLAGILGGELAASRAPCDAGWVEPNLQVGQTGKKVAPDFYLAVAVSGASQHVMGVTDAKVIAAINTDEDAPIFRHCQFGLVEDYRKVIGLLRRTAHGALVMNPNEATREVLWNIRHGWIMYALFVPTLAVAALRRLSPRSQLAVRPTRATI